MLKGMAVFTLFLAGVSGAAGAALVVDRDSVVYEGGTYDRVEVNGHRYVTLRNVTVQNNMGTNDYAGIHINSARYVVVDGCEVNGLAGNGRGTCGGIKVDGSGNVVIRSTRIHNCNDDGIRTWFSTYVDILDCEIHHLLGCGTDDGCSQCNNGHSDGMQILNTWGVNIRRNLVYDVYSTSALFLSGAERPGSKWAVVENNLFYTPRTGFVVYLFETTDLKFYNNTVWGEDKGGHGGLSIGHDLTGLKMYNNIILHVNVDHLSYVYKAEDEWDYNIMGKIVQNFRTGTHDKIYDDPGFVRIPARTQAQIFGTVAAADFALKSTSPAVNFGTAGADVPATDFYGRGRNGLPDAGAIEYGGTGNQRERVWFTAANREGTAPLNVSFSNTSPSAFTGWKWDFGDGSTSTQKNPSHSYTGNGKYTVTLIGTGANGADTLTVRFYVAVNGGTDIRGTKAREEQRPDVAVVPNPFTEGVTLQAVAKRADQVTAAVYDPAGGLVSRLNPVNAAGSVFHWDCTDDAGANAGKGVYFYTVTVNGIPATGKLFKLQ